MNGVTNIKSWTVERLERLKPGEEFIYYKGNWQEDFNRCNARLKTRDKGAEEYQKLLREIRETVMRLKREKKITIKERPISKPPSRIGHRQRNALADLSNIGIIEYIAVGIGETTTA